MGSLFRLYLAVGIAAGPFACCLFHLSRDATLIPQHLSATPRDDSCCQNSPSHSTPNSMPATRDDGQDCPCKRAPDVAYLTQVAEPGKSLVEGLAVEGQSLAPGWFSSGALTMVRVVSHPRGPLFHPDQSGPERLRTLAVYRC